MVMKTRDGTRGMTTGLMEIHRGPQQHLLFSPCDLRDKNTSFSRCREGTSGMQVFMACFRKRSAAVLWPALGEGQRILPAFYGWLRERRGEGEGRLTFLPLLFSSNVNEPYFGVVCLEPHQLPNFKTTSGTYQRLLLFFKEKKNCLFRSLKNH